MINTELKSMVNTYIFAEPSEHLTNSKSNTTVPALNGRCYPCISVESLRTFVGLLDTSARALGTRTGGTLWYRSERNTIYPRGKNTFET